MNGTTNGTSTKMTAEKSNGTIELGPGELLQRWLAERSAPQPMRAVDIAEKLGVREATLVASAVSAREGSIRVTRLAPRWDPLLRGLMGVGSMKAITRNGVVVNEIVGRYEGVEISGTMGQAVGEIDLRLFLSRWSSAFYVVDEGGRHPQRSIQFFDDRGVAIHKTYVQAETNIAAFDALVKEFTIEGTEPPAATLTPREQKVERADFEVDVLALRTEWDAMQDTHEFFHLLRRHDTTRTQALRLAGAERAQRVANASTETLLTSLSSSGLTVMVFVGNPGLIQIYIGPVHRVVSTHGWLNVLDPKFNLHVRQADVASTWLVRKPTARGIVTSLELFDARGEQVLHFVGKRPIDGEESTEWRDTLARSVSPY